MDGPERRLRVIGAIRNVHMDGYNVFRDNISRPDGIRMGVLMDLVAADTAVVHKLVNTALTLMHAARCWYAVALANPAMLTAQILAATGFNPDPHEEPFIFVIKPYATDLYIQALSEPASWLLSYGDTDHMG